MHFRERYIAFIQDDVSMRVVRKTDSKFMHFLKYVLFFVPRFMSQYSTTIGNTMYATNIILQMQGPSVLDTLTHEAQHIWDSKRWPLLYELGYLFPQILTPLALLACFDTAGGLWWLLCLLCLLPLPAPFRMIIERRGYLATLLVGEWRDKRHATTEQYTDTVINNIVKQFTGRSYLFMWPFKRSLTKWFKKRLQENRDGKTLGTLLETTRRFMKENTG